jgi:transposase InsO family protein
MAADYADSKVAAETIVEAIADQSDSPLAIPGRRAAHRRHRYRLGARTASTPSIPSQPLGALPTSVDDVYRRCRDLGMRLSRQRRMVLDLLWVERSHLSARDIFEKLNNQGRKIGHTSV